MKKLISLILSVIILISITLLTLILNINIITKYKTIENISNQINYLDLVNLPSKQNDIKETYDSIYLNLQENSLSQKEIELFYKQPFLKKVSTKIIYVESNYLLTGKNNKTYTKEQLDNLVEKSINNLDNLDKSSKERLINIIKPNNTKILTIENIVRSNINNTDINKINIIRFLLSNNLKIILILITIISIVISFLINREKILPYIFIPTTICSNIEILVALFMPNILNNLLSNKFLVSLIYPYIKVLSNNLLVTALIILIVSLFYLILNEKITIKEKSRIKPKLGVK